jgi:tetratricopeptide (TPR) repeat protein
MADNNSNFLIRILRILIAFIGVGLCLVGIWMCARVALSNLLLNQAMSSANIVSVNNSIRLNSANAEAYYVRAAFFRTLNAKPQALTELEHAVALRPRDYYFWLELGLLRDELHDPSGALAAMNEAVRLAPYYAQPLWQRGNLLLRSGKYAEAFRDLNQAAQSNPIFAPNVIDLAWGISRRDPKITEQLAQINNDGMRLVFVGYLAKRGEAQEALNQFRLVREVPEEKRREIASQLIAAGAFTEAYQVWENSTTSSPDQIPQISDPSFEGPLRLDEGAFGWRVPNALPGVNLSLDSTNPHTGSKSFHVEFDGPSSPDASILSQLLVVSPGQKYKIGFMARAADLVSGGQPVVQVYEARGEKKKLAESNPLSNTDANWKPYSLEFASSSETKVVSLRVQRQNCSSSPCPIFGSLWLDSFAIEQVK